MTAPAFPVPNLTVKIKDRSFTRYIDLEGMGITLSFLQPYSFVTNRGCKQAVIRADGTIEALQQLFLHLRGAVEIYDGSAEPCWFGCLWTVVVFHDKLKYGFTLDEMGNKINVVYVLQTVNQAYSGSGSKAETGYASDTDSIADYGTIERRIRRSNSSQTAAESARTTLLAKLKNPTPIRTEIVAAGGTYALLTVESWIKTLGWRFYENATGNAAGFEQNDDVSDEESQFLGRSHPARTTLSFVASTGLMEDTSSTMVIDDESPYNHIFVEGSASGNNDKVWEVDSVPQPGRQHLLVEPPNVADEAAGASITVKDVGQKIYQSFELATNNPFYAVAVDIRIKKHLSPVDGVLVKLYTDSGSNTPNTLLATGTITNEEIPTYMAWKTAVLDTPSLLSFGTKYGIEISRSSPSTDLNAYEIGVDAGASYTRGVLKLYTNATHGWANRLVAADLAFKVSGTVETTTQIQSIISSVSEFITAVILDTSSGVFSIPYQDGERTALQVIENLLALGTSNNRRLFMRVDVDRKLIIYEEPANTDAGSFLLDSDGVLTARNGDALSTPPHRGPFSYYAKLKPLELLEGIPAANKFVFLEGVSYDPRTGELKPILTENQKGAYDLTSLRQ